MSRLTIVLSQSYCYSCILRLITGRWYIIIYLPPLKPTPITNTLCLSGFSITFPMRAFPAVAPLIFSDVTKDVGIGTYMVGLVV